ncbi:MAG TPA: cohesin domain-containing protein, partial [bacterium]|nr:cohesin domain-containing protein [bacterium]
MAEKAQTLNVKRIFGSGLLFVALFVYSPVHAASQYFSPSGGSYKAHSTFAVSVYAESLDQPASAFSADIHFPPDKLQVVALAKGESIINIWVQEPSYANDTGTIRFEGLIPNPGYIGTGGKLLTITFEAVGDAPVDLTFADGVILANDGYGTDITDGLGAAAFTLVADDTQPSGDAVPQNGVQSVKVDQGPHRPAGTVEGIQTA